MCDVKCVCTVDMYYVYRSWSELWLARSEWTWSWRNRAFRWKTGLQLMGPQTFLSRGMRSHRSDRCFWETAMLLRDRVAAGGWINGGAGGQWGELNLNMVSGGRFEERWWEKLEREGTPKSRKTKSVTGKGGTDWGLEDWVGYSNIMPASSAEHGKWKHGVLTLRGDRDRRALAFKACMLTSERLELNLTSISSVQLLSHIWLFATPWTTARQASLSITDCQSLPKPMSIESVMPSNHLILCRSLLLLPSIFPSIRVFSNNLYIH